MGMLFDQAIALAERGELITRPGYGEYFVIVRDGLSLYGCFICARKGAV